jgi:hypothetical protein
MITAKEENLRDTDDLKRHWVKTLCNGMKKPIGGTGEKGERICHANIGCCVVSEIWHHFWELP